MKKFLIFAVIFISFLSVEVSFAGQFTLCNKSGRQLEFSITIFHNKAKQKMVLESFMLRSGQETRFPKPGDLHLATPLKLKVSFANDPASEISTSFDKKDVGLHKINVIRKSGRLEFQKN